MLRHYVLAAAFVAFAGPAFADPETPQETVVKPTAAATTVEEAETSASRASVPATARAEGAKSTPAMSFGRSGCSWSVAAAPTS